jgi:nitroreductase
MNAIFERRSIRKFLDTDIKDTDITTLLKAAMRAPSAGNEQPWEFIVIKNPETMIKITEFHPYASMLHHCKCAIIVCGNVERQKFDYNFWVQDCSAATQNILVEATHLGLGSVWLGVHPIVERVTGIQTIFHLPKEIIPLNVIALGYPEIMPKEIDTYNESFIHYEKW